MKQSLLKSIADLRFAIIILLVIAFCSIIGTIIEQDQSIEIYKSNYPLNSPVLGFLSWDLILKFGLDHVYKTWWFFTLIIIFATSLISCTILQQIPSLKIARRCQFFRTSQPFSKLKVHRKIFDSNLSQLLFKIKQNQYSIFQQKNILYCYKGLIGRIAPLIVHFSMILILLGSLLGSITGFKAQEIIPKTETFHIQNIVANGQLTLIPRISTRINDFWITYSPKKTINQFYSNISMLDKTGNEIWQKTIFVNSPARYNNITYYQSDWNLISLRVKDENSLIYQYPLVNIFNNQNKIWLSWVPNTADFNDGLTVLVNNLQGYCSVYNKFGNFIGNLELNESFQTDQTITLLDLIGSTGLQIKVDPGIPIIYSGFAFLMLSTLISYLTYSQVWVVKNGNTIYLAGNTTRATFEFELEFFSFSKLKSFKNTD